MNPFAVGDKVIIAILPHENANKLMAKWKGPFTVTKIPNRFQIEYLDDNVTRLTHISYAKKYNERCQYTERLEMPRQKRVSRVRPWVKMARLRLIAGKGRNKIRMVVPSMKAIQDKWPIHSGPIHVKILGEGEALSSDLQAVVDAAGPDSFIEGNVLVDLCEQRSGQRGSGCDAPAEADELPVTLVSGCDAPAEAEELPMPLASPPKPPTLPYWGKERLFPQIFKLWWMQQDLILSSRGMFWSTSASKGLARGGVVVTPLRRLTNSL